jgi:cytochrome c oxidase subunit II
LRRTRRQCGGVAALAALTLLVVTGCENDQQSVLDPVSHPARDIASLWWWMLAGAAVIFVGAVALLGLAWARRKRSGLPVFGDNEGIARGLVVVFGILIPIATLIALYTIGNILVLPVTQAPAAGSTSLTVQVVGHQWWWEVRYPGTNAVTANEIHIPVSTRVLLVGRSADVIHSFWAPNLNRKIDVIPGRENQILLYSDRPGRYRAQCSEFCGVQHAHMSLYVYVEPKAVFEDWLGRVSQPASAPAGTEAEEGRKLFASMPCAGCHTIRGTSAAGSLGPDLTHVASRETLAALTIPNDPDYLAGWIADPQHYKPGNRMPGLDLDDSELQALVAYLEGLE